jgi:hypothetical protein
MSYRHAVVTAACCGLCWLAAVGGLARPAAADIEQLQKDFQMPPEDARIMVRWWWFGPAVTKAGIDRELAAMKAGGIGGVEVQPTYPLVVDGGSGENAAKNIKWMSPEFLDMVGYAAGKAKEMGMRFDLTLGSGWPYGGPMFDAQTEGAKQVATQVVNVSAGQTTVRSNSRTALAAFAGPGGAPVRGGGRGGAAGGGGDLGTFKEVPLHDGVAQLPSDFAGGQVIFFESRPAGLTAVKRPAYGADGPIIDHLNAKAVDKFIELVAEPEIKACGMNPPVSIFCDSLEVTGENWTEDFLAEFQKRRGYDLRPLLPALIGDFGERTADIRHDYGQTVTDLFNENFNAKFTALAKKYHTRFRIQGYGSPPAALSSFAFADLPEGEGGGNGNWRTFRATRYAASASHLMGERLASSETLTWLHQAPFRAVPLDIKGEVDTHFLDGINQIDCHGWPYTPNTLAYPGASFYAAAVFDEKNPWYIAMPEISAYIQRVSQMMREGAPANDVALYANDSDVWAGAGPGFSSMNTTWTGQTALLDAILSAGYNLDLWDDGMLAMKGRVKSGSLVFGDVKYRIVTLNGTKNMPLATARRMEEFAKGGGILVWVGSGGQSPHVPGYGATEAEQQELAAIFGRLFGAGGPGIVAPTVEQFAALVGVKVPADFVVTPVNPAIGAVHRHADGGEIYFVANTSARKQSVRATFGQVDRQAEEWNPLNSRIRPLPVVSRTSRGTTLALDLEPYGSTIVVFTRRTLAMPASAVAVTPLDLSTGWAVTFGSSPGGSGTPVAIAMDALTDWKMLPGKANYSGVASYEKKIAVPAELTKAAVMLSFGEVTAAVGGVRGGQGFAAEANAPVRDAAVVYVNGKRVGAAWCAPYQVDVSGVLKEGENAIRIEVGNTAVNYLAGVGFPNYDQRAVDAAFPPGNRFQPQGMQLYAQPLPSGLTGPIKLEAAR